MERKISFISLVLSVLVVSAAGLGLLDSSLYQDNLLVRSGWYGNDLVTLILALPILILSTVLINRQKPAGSLLCAGVLAYFLYCYAFYLFGASFNKLFLVYVAILATSTFGLISVLASPQVQQISHTIKISNRRRASGLLVILVSLSLGGFWISTCVGHLLTGKVPAMVRAVDHPTNVTGALDLWLVVSFGLVSGLWLLKRRPWGYIIAVIWSIKGVLYMAALSAAAVAQYINGAVDSMAQLYIWAPVGSISLLILVLLSGTSREKSSITADVQIDRAGKVKNVSP